MNTSSSLTYFVASYGRLFFAACLLLGMARGAESAPFYLKDGDKVVFYGDSITEQRLYTTYVETFVLTRFPKLKVDFVHSGWGGDRVTGGGGGPIDLRLHRDVLAYSPTVVTIMLGMNDGGYHPADPGTTDTYEKGYQYIIEQLKGSLPNVRLTLIQPSPHDDVTRPPDFPGGYNSVLKTFAAFVKDTADKNGQTTADFNTPVVHMLTKAAQIDSNLATQLIPDRVHPSPAGHLIMAEALLKAWNAPSAVSTVEIDANSQKVTETEGATIDDLKIGDALNWTETDAALPMPVMPSDPNDTNTKRIQLSMESSDFMKALNQEILQITNLKAPYYSLDIDHEDVGIFSKESLAQGINLAAQSTPMMDQATGVHALTLKHNDLHFERWRTIEVSLESKNSDVINKALPPILAELDSQEAAVVEQQRAKAQPVPHLYSLTPQKTAEGSESAAPESLLPNGVGPNLALNKKYICSNPNTHGWDSGLTDGSWAEGSGTTFASNDDPLFPKTATVDLEEVKRIAYVQVGVPAFGSTARIEVSVSTDNQSFTTVGVFTFPQGKTRKHLYAFPAVEARYIRLTYPNHYAKQINYDSNFVFTTELEAYGPAGG